MLEHKSIEQLQLNEQFLEKLEAGELQTAEKLLGQKAQIDALDPQGNTALIRAAEQDQPEIVRFLLAHGAQVNVQNKLGYTAIMLAAKYGSTESVRLLLEHGAQTELTNIHRITALKYAAQNNYPAIVRLLLAYGAQVSTSGFSALVRKLLKSHEGFSSAVKQIPVSSLQLDWPALTAAGQEPFADSTAFLKEALDDQHRNNLKFYLTKHTGSQNLWRRPISAGLCFDCMTAIIVCTPKSVITLMLAYIPIFELELSAKSELMAIAEKNDGLLKPDTEDPVSILEEKTSVQLEDQALTQLVQLHVHASMQQLEQQAKMLLVHIRESKLADILKIESPKQEAGSKIEQKGYKDSVCQEAFKLAASAKDVRSCALLTACHPDIKIDPALYVTLRKENAVMNEFLDEINGTSVNIRFILKAFEIPKSFLHQLYAPSKSIIASIKSTVMASPPEVTRWRAVQKLIREADQTATVAPSAIKAPTISGQSA